MSSLRSRLIYWVLKIRRPPFEPDKSVQQQRAALISPIYADLHGLPPLLVQVGDCEVLLSDSIRLAERARRAGVDATLEIWDGMWHVWQAYAGYVPEAQQVLASLPGRERGR